MITREDEFENVLAPNPAAEHVPTQVAKTDLGSLSSAIH